MLNDLRYALRTLRMSPLFTFMAMLSLALGIGANTAIYSFIDAILVRTLPVRNPESLVVLKWHTNRDRRPGIVRSISGTNYNDARLGRVSPNLPYPFFEMVRENPVFEPTVAFNNAYRLTALIRGQGSAVDGMYV